MSICFIIAPQNKDTILDRIAHEIGKSFDQPIYHYGTVGLPKAERYFVTHYTLLPQVVAQVNPGITPVTVFYTHNKGNLSAYLELFNLCHSVIAESPEGMKELGDLGVIQELLHFVPECADPNQFKPHARTHEGAILVCGTNYADGRKNPEMIKQIINLLPNGKFWLLGKGWKDSIKGNCSFLEERYFEYPHAYNNCSVYLSCSKLEGGGPNSLIEAMHANLVPVVSDTGNAREYIIDGYNGFIFPHDSTPEYVASLIEKAYALDPAVAIPYNDVWQTVRHMTWDNYSLQMKEIILSDFSKTNSQELIELTEDDSTN